MQAFPNDDVTFGRGLNHRESAECGVTRQFVAVRPLSGGVTSPLEQDGIAGSPRSAEPFVRLSRRSQGHLCSFFP